MAVHSNFLISVLLWNYFTIISALFTVRARKSHYIVEYGSNVSMECQFTMDMGTHVENLKVLWQHSRDKMNSVEVAKYINGKDIEILQGKNLSGRMKILSYELHKGYAILHISNVKMTDAGQYLCIISSDGSDYKVMDLDVQAPYKEITAQVKDVVNSSGKTVREVSCQSFGYPEAKVTWMVDKENLTVVHNISHILTADGLFTVTSVVRVPATSNRTFTCTFWNEITGNATSLTFTVSENVKKEKSQEWKFTFASLAILIAMVFLLTVVYTQCRRFHHKKTNSHNNICANEAPTINANMSSKSEYSSNHSGNKSKNTIIDVETPSTRLTHFLRSVK
ncbi:programmed cell death 1 ligand 2-like [Rhinoderma darwinii]|uniref:programmed cell death 1 ligand 2-like n=1 Tax=Rhinoderma darwinii TaxID=43563 RepID=UPI003F662F9F